MAKMKSLSDLFKGWFPNGDNELGGTCREQAKNRLHIVLVEDRNGLNENPEREEPTFLPNLKNDLMDVLKRYFPAMNENDLEVTCSDLESTKVIAMSVSLNTDENTQDLQANANTLEKK